MVDYALRFIALSLGLRLELVDDGSADLCYSERPSNAGVVWLPYRRECYEPAEPHVAVTSREHPLWVPSRLAIERPIDLIGGVARLLCLLDEGQVAEIDRGDDGVFGVAALPSERRARHREPMVDWHVAEIRDLLSRAGLASDGHEARWPEGAKYAVVLTHDTDAAGLHDLRELLRVSVRAGRYRSSGVLSIAASAVAGWVRGSPDPQFQFLGWAGLERSLGVRSAFYLHVREGRRRHRHDPTYTVQSQPRWRVLEELVTDGWEVGIHAAIGSGKSALALARERELLEAVTKHPVEGLRHHYWRLDWRSPWRTFRNHEAAGYRYDTSIAWRDRDGFRAGTSQPYHPYDAERGRALSILELPTTVMDGHLFEYLRMTSAEATDALLGLADVVRQAGGVLNLNWHQETFVNQYAHRGWVDTYRSAVSELAADSDAWIATPSRVAQWWRDRSARLGDITQAASSESRERAGGPDQ